VALVRREPYDLRLGTRSTGPACMNQSPKEVAGRRAAEFVTDGMTLGLGTGSTVYFTLLALSERIRAGGLRVRGVPTSLDTERKALEMGIPLATLDEVESLDLCIDGADEIDGDFAMIKGGGGALLREKVVASIARRVVIVVGPEKVVARLGTTFALPVEVAPFARPVVWRALAKLGCEPKLRTTREGATFLTDNHNEILDCRFASGIADVPALERAIDAIPGVVESGLFVGLAHALVIGHPDGRAEVRQR
jgi:ribose 5-phosphate isomerase A